MEQSTRYEHLKEMTDHEFASKLQKTKEERQRVEDNVNSLRARIKFLQNEEDKLLVKIDATIIKADEVSKVKNYARFHSGLLNWAKDTNEKMLQDKKATTKEMKEDLENGMHKATRQVYIAHKREADGVRDKLEKLNDSFEARRRAQFHNLVEKAHTQKESERNWVNKKNEMLENTMNMSRIRYDSEVSSQQGQIESYNAMIPQLEIEEKRMIEKLKQTQTQCQVYVDDLNRIHNNKRPTGPLAKRVSLK